MTSAAMKTSPQMMPNKLLLRNSMEPKLKRESSMPQQVDDENAANDQGGIGLPYDEGEDADDSPMRRFLQNGELQLPQKSKSDSELLTVISDDDNDEDGENRTSQKEQNSLVDVAPADSAESSSSLPSTVSEHGYSKSPTPPPSDILGDILMQENVQISDNDDEMSQKSLEARVHDLEAKLATLSLLLQQQRMNFLRPSSPVTTPIRAQSPSDKVSRATPALDSPAPPMERKGGLHKRNLSFKILYQEGDEKQKASLLKSLASAAHSGNVSPGSITSGSESPAEAAAEPPSPPLLSFSRIHRDYDAKKVRRVRGRASSFDVYPRSSETIVSTATIPLNCFLPTSKTFDVPGIRKKSASLFENSESDKTRNQLISDSNHSTRLRGRSRVDSQDMKENDGNRKSRGIPKVESNTSNATMVSSNKEKDKNKDKSNDKSKKEKAGREKETNWLDFLNSSQESTHDIDAQMEEFIKVPGAVETLMGYGFWICVDSFLYVLTILPIRFIWSCLLLIRYSFLWCKTGGRAVPEGPYRFHRRHSYQFIQVGIICAVYKYVLLPVSIGKLYHWIRGQNMVKLYVLVAIVEVFDRLMCSLGQDCLDSLYWNVSRRPKSSRLIVSIVVVLVYATLHSCLLFVHVATLNVAMNSADQALLTMLIGGNFAEIKSTVFKKYNKPSLFKITASDICERFKLALFLGLVLMLNFTQGMDEAMVYSYVQMCGIVWCAEWIADWIKHAFISKLNFIESRVYYEYALLLAGDVTGIGHEGVNLDHTHAVVKRIGLAQIPLVCVMARYLREAFKYYAMNNLDDDDDYGDTAISDPNDAAAKRFMQIVTFFCGWLVLLLLKTLLGRILHKISKARLKAAPGLLRDIKVNSKKKKE